MALTNDYPFTERENGIGGVQRVYSLGSKWELSLINSPIAHRFPYAWEAALIWDSVICYSTALTSNVEVFQTGEETNEFIHLAAKYAKNFPEGPPSDTSVEESIDV